MSTPNDRVRSLLIEALTQANSPQLDTIGKNRSLFSSIYWIENQQGQIEIFLSTWHFHTGQFHASFRPGDLAEHVQTLFVDDEAQAAALVAALEYIKSVALTLLPITQNKLIKRAVHNAATNDKGGLSALFEMMQAAYVDSRTAAEKKLEGKRSSRGGSDPRLKPQVRDSLHLEYDQLHSLTREVKKDYRNIYKAFDKAHRKHGFSRAQWIVYWSEHCQQKYPSHLQGLVQLFAENDELSAANVACEYLGKQLGHKSSYTQRLVRDSRKKARIVNSDT
jgi:hypothetical protein